MNPLEKIAFELNGGWPALIGMWVASAIKYLAIGFLFGLGLRWAFYL
jgi:hypothetical protein